MLCPFDLSHSHLIPRSYSRAQTTDTWRFTTCKIHVFFIFNYILLTFFNVAFFRFLLGTTAHWLLPSPVIPLGSWTSVTLQIMNISCPPPPITPSRSGMWNQSSVCTPSTSTRIKFGGSPTIRKATKWSPFQRTKAFWSTTFPSETLISSPWLTQFVIKHSLQQIESKPHIVIVVFGKKPMSINFSYILHQIRLQWK